MDKTEQQTDLPVRCLPVPQQTGTQTGCQALVKLAEIYTDSPDKAALIKYLRERLAQGLPINPASLPVDIRSKCYRYGIYLPANRKKRIYGLFGTKPDEIDIVTDKYLKGEYRRLIREYHPDFNPDDPLAGNKINIIVRAFRQLMKWRKKLVCLLMTAALILFFWK